MEYVCLITDQKHQRMEETWQERELSGVQQAWAMMISGNPSLQSLTPLLNLYPGMSILKILVKWLPEKLKSQAVLQKNSVPLPLMMELQWGTQECSIAYPLGN